MNKNFMKFMALAVFALPIALTSCNKDDDEPEQSEEKQSVLDGEEYLKETWLTYDSTGTVIGTAFGKMIDSSLPTVAFIGVDDLADAKEHFISVVAPGFAEKSVGGDDITVILTDTLNNEKNKLFFKVVNDGETFAKVYLEKNIGIENIVSEIRYIDASLWPENVGGTCPFLAGAIYKHWVEGGWRNFVCLRTPGKGLSGLLVADINDNRNISVYGKRGSEEKTANFAHVSDFHEVHGFLANNTLEFWQKFARCAGQFKVSTIKSRWYWTTEQPHNDEDITIYNFGQSYNKDNKYATTSVQDPYYWGGADEYVLVIYRIYEPDDKHSNYWLVRCTSSAAFSNQWEDKYPGLDSFARNRDLEVDSGNVTLQ